MFGAWSRLGLDSFWSYGVGSPAVVMQVRMRPLGLLVLRKQTLSWEVLGSSSFSS
jgi:hypothetical protein